MIKSLGVVLLLVGMLFLGIGGWTYYQSKAPRACEVSFVTALGGKSSFAFGESLRQKNRLGLGEMAVGSLAVLAGGYCLLRLKVKRKVPPV
ncbi:MAG: hypothetical protein JXQ81_10270 [Desulfuromonadales bacterium]|nr:hypothetical protein [Desulfuromonadales bacterium]MBN2792881.1 hypothetical protein [Desulfuromonadales bacterium]